MKAIPLTKGFATIVDDEDYDRLTVHKWCALLGKNGQVYAIRNAPRNHMGRRGMILMHREILGAKDNEMVDHRNFDGLDNRRENLRLCDRSKNSHYRRKFTPTRFPYRGITGIRHGKYMARIKLNGKDKALGSFATIEEAAKAYDTATSVYFGEFAKPNSMTL